MMKFPLQLQRLKDSLLESDELVVMFLDGSFRTLGKCPITFLCILYSTKEECFLSLIVLTQSQKMPVLHCHILKCINAHSL